jgi:uncharacterized protein YehS (DUF1456 family)
MVELFAKGDLTVTPEQVTLWLKKDDDPDYVRCTDHEFAHFLNGLTIEKRGPREDGVKPKAEYALNNNIIFRKLKIAFNLKDQDILDLLKNADFNLGKAELSAFFRKPEHRHYRECQDQVLRNFLQGLQLRETNTSTAERQSQFQAIKAKAANKKAAAKKEKSNNKKSGHVNPYAKDKPKGEKVVYKNPNKTPKEDKEKRPKLSLKKDKQKKESSDHKPESNGGFSWKK